MYMKAKANSGSLLTGLSTADKARGKLVMRWFDAMATREELAKLGPPAVGDEPPSAGERKRIVWRLQELIVRRLRGAFLSARKKIPTALNKGTELKCSAIESRIKEMKDQKRGQAFSVDASPAAFAAFRATVDEASLASTSAASSAATSAAEPKPQGKVARLV